MQFQILFISENNSLRFKCLKYLTVLSPPPAGESFPTIRGGSLHLPHLLCREGERRGETRQRALCIAVELPHGWHALGSDWHRRVNPLLTEMGS